MFGLDKVLGLLYNRGNNKEETMDGIDDYFELMFYSQGE
jgi:hypothetical protein